MACNLQPFTVITVDASFLLAQDVRILKSARNLKYFVKTAKMTTENAKSTN